MTHDPSLYLAAALGAASTTAATVASNPQIAIDGATGAIGSGLLVVLWRLANMVTRHLEEVQKHREQHCAEWTKQDQHRAAEREHWKASAVLIATGCEPGCN